MRSHSRSFSSFRINTTSLTRLLPRNAIRGACFQVRGIQVVSHCGVDDVRSSNHRIALATYALLADLRHRSPLPVSFRISPLCPPVTTRAPTSVSCTMLRNARIASLRCVSIVAFAASLTPRHRQPSAVICHTSCSSSQRNIYAPQTDSMRWCPRCWIWFHTVCLRIARPQCLGDGAIEPEELNIAWTAPPPRAPGQLKWQILLRTPIQRIPQRAAHGHGGPASIELALFAARQYYMEHNRSPSSLQTWLPTVHCDSLSRRSVISREPGILHLSHMPRPQSLV